MANTKKPDSIVFNAEIEKYDAALKPYATNLGAPVISTIDTLLWKKRSIDKINKKIKAKYLELRAEYAKMMHEYENNQLIYNAKFSFEPIVGEVYYLYKRENGETFLSLVEPNHFSFKFLGSFYLNADGVWEKSYN